MIYSKKQNFVFIKTRKTAGTAIEIALSKYCGSQDILTPLAEEGRMRRIKNKGPNAQNYRIGLGDFTRRSDYLDVLKLGWRKRRPLFYNHISALEVRSILGKKAWLSTFTFCFERNPFDKARSGYTYFLKEHKKSPSEISFESFLDFSNMYVNHPIYCGSNKIPLVEHLGRYENLEEEMRFVENKCGLLPKALQLKKINVSGRREKKDVFHWRKHYSHEGRQIVEEKCQWELDYFGYDF